MKWIRLEWDRTVAVACAVFGAAALILGWLGLSRTAFPAEQMSYMLSGGIGGLFLLALGGILWLSADLRDEWRKLDAIEERLGDGEMGAAAALPEPARRLESRASEPISR